MVWLLFMFFVFAHSSIYVKHKNKKRLSIHHPTLWEPFRHIALVVALVVWFLLFVVLDWDVDNTKAITAIRRYFLVTPYNIKPLKEMRQSYKNRFQVLSNMIASQNEYWTNMYAFAYCFLIIQWIRDKIEISK